MAKKKDFGNLPQAEGICHLNGAISRWSFGQRCQAMRYTWSHPRDATETITLLLPLMSMDRLANALARCRKDKSCSVRSMETIFTCKY
jgi:hypothetical protein